MAIASWDLEGIAPDACDLLEVPWPKPVLRVVSAGADRLPDEDTEEPPAAPAARWASSTGDRQGVAAMGARIPVVGLAAAPRQGCDVGVRRRQRAAVRTRRRRFVLAAVVVGLAVGLGLPLRALGGAPAPAPRAAAAVATEALYVVQPGDTLWSIASRLDPHGDPRALAEALAKQTGSEAVVPGERLAIP